MYNQENYFNSFPFQRNDPFKDKDKLRKEISEKENKINLLTKKNKEYETKINNLESKNKELYNDEQKFEHPNRK